jgi:hypothetical protein
MRAWSVYDNLNEMNFERRGTPLDVLGIGQKILIEKWLIETKVKNYTINDDYTIDVKENIDLYMIGSYEFPKYIKFNSIDGYFICDVCGLTSLIGCPNYVKGIFRCRENRLTSLDDCPKHVGSFDCGENGLSSLIGCPTYVEYNFYCDCNALTSLKGCPQTINGVFSCCFNDLISLEGCPTLVGGDFLCQGNKKKFTEKYVRSLCNVKGKIEL